LQCLQVYVFPPDLRSIRGGKLFSGLRSLLGAAEPARQRRSRNLVTAQEIGRLLLALPIWAVLAMVIWSRLPFGPNIGFFPWVWRAMVFVWVAGVGLFLTAGFFEYFRHRKMSHTEATLYMQDLLWHETRREQRRLNRWRTWAKLKQERREASRRRKPLEE
jgi:hypothetical protein